MTLLYSVLFPSYWYVLLANDTWERLQEHSNSTTNGNIDDTAAYPGHLTRPYKNRSACCNVMHH